MGPLSNSRRFTLRLVTSGGFALATLAATLNRFHFRSILLDPHARSCWTLFLADKVFSGDVKSFRQSGKQMMEFCRVEGHAGGPIPLTRAYHAELAAFLSPYFLVEGKLDNRTPAISDTAMDSLADAFEGEILQIIGLSKVVEPRKFGLCVTVDVDVVGKSSRANIVSGLVFLRNAVQCLFHPRRLFFQAFLAAKFISGEVDYCGFETILANAYQQGYTPEFFLYARLPEGNRLSLWERMRGVNPNYALEWGIMRMAISRLLSAGASVGLHGSYRSYIDEDLLALEKSHLEKHTKVECISIRQHYLNMGGQRTFDSYAKAGIAYESNCGYVTQNGFFCHTARPFYVVPPGNGFKGVVAVPMAFMDAVPLYFEPKTPKETEQDLIRIISSVKRSGGLVSLNFHQRMVQSIPEYAGLLRGAVKEVVTQGGEVGPLSMTDVLYPEAVLE